jgi:hypothetical protein
MPLVFNKSEFYIHTHWTLYDTFCRCRNDNITRDVAASHVTLRHHTRHCGITRDVAASHVTLRHHTWRCGITCDIAASHVTLQHHMWSCGITCNFAASRATLRYHAWRCGITCDVARGRRSRQLYPIELKTNCNGQIHFSETRAFRRFACWTVSDKNKEDWISGPWEVNFPALVYILVFLTHTECKKLVLFSFLKACPGQKVILNLISQ